MINLTETQRLKDAVDKNPADFQNIIEDTNLGVCITNEEGNYVGMNKNYLKMLGYAKEEMVGKSFLMVVPPAHKEDLADLHEQFIEVQIEIFEKFEILDKHGKLLKIDVDAGFTDKINGKPHKLTFIQPAE